MFVGYAIVMVSTKSAVGTFGALYMNVAMA